MKLVVIGVPSSGKSTVGRYLAAALVHPLVSTDNFIHLGWNEAKAAVLETALNLAPDVVVEGITAARILNEFDPSVIVLCRRDVLASPMHRSMAARLERALEEWPYPERVIVVRNAHQNKEVFELLNQLRKEHN